MTAPLPCRIGPFTLPLPAIQAGLAGYSDMAMRVVARRRGCPLAVTEALLDQVLLRGGRGLEKGAILCPEDHPVAGQLMGSDPGELARAAVVLVQMGFDVIDLNFACPVRKVMGRCRGGYLLSDPDTAIAILRRVRDAVPGTPLTVKLRRALNDTPQAADWFDRVFDEARTLQFAAIAVHARTVEQKYEGTPDWSFLKQLAQRLTPAVFNGAGQPAPEPATALNRPSTSPIEKKKSKIENPPCHPVTLSPCHLVTPSPHRPALLGSGDIFSAHDALRMLQQTGVDAVWFARGAIGNPWIFADFAALLAGRPLPPPPTVHEQRDALLEHFALAVEVYGEEIASRQMRKIAIKYAKLHPHGPTVWKEFIAVKNQKQWNEVLARHYTTDAPGIRPPPVPDAQDVCHVRYGAAEPTCE